MFILTCLLLFQQPDAESTDFPRPLQARVIAATVLVGNPARKIEGSGVIVGKKDNMLYVLTAYHVVHEDSGRLEITVFSQNPRSETTYRFAQVVAKLPGTTDLALVQVAATKPTPEVVPIFPIGETIKQNRIAAMSAGCARSLPPVCHLIRTVEKKIVQRQLGGDTSIFWQSPEKAVKGRSGGPLINSQGQVVGICSGASEGKCFYSHIDEIHRLLKQDGFSFLAEKK